MQTGIVLQVNANPTVNVVMALGAVSEQITVQANAAMVETRATSVGQVMENQRPNLVGDWKLASPTATTWFNTAAFALPAPGTYGNLTRNALRGPGTWNVDTAITRKFAAGGGRQIEVRAEAFNVFNVVRAGVAGTSIAGIPNTTFTNSLFGKVTTAADPRIMQFAVKYVF